MVGVCGNRSNGLRQFFNIFIEMVDVLENKGWVTETEDYYKIGCTITSNIVPDLCRMIDPTGHEYAIRSNLATERYTTFQTNLLNKTCGIEVRTHI